MKRFAVVNDGRARFDSRPKRVVLKRFFPESFLITIL